MTNQEIAQSIFKSRDKAIIDFDFRGIGNEQEINERHGYNHGWIVVNGESFNHEAAFPEQHHPRFPADQGVSD